MASILENREKWLGQGRKPPYNPKKRNKITD